MGGLGQLMPAPVATAGVKEESQGKALSLGRGSQSLALLTHWNKSELC